MSFIDLFGYTFMVLLAMGGAAGARLQKTGDLLALSKVQPGWFYGAVLLSITNLAGVFYFSWMYFQWPHWLAFLTASLVVTPALNKLSNRIGLWLMFGVPGVSVLVAELLLLIHV